MLQSVDLHASTFNFLSDRAGENSIWVAILLLLGLCNAIIECRWAAFNTIAFQKITVVRAKNTFKSIILDRDKQNKLSNKQAISKRTYYCCCCRHELWWCVCWRAWQQFLKVTLFCICKRKESSQWLQYYWDYCNTIIGHPFTA